MDENASKIEQNCSKGIWVGKSSRNDTQQTKWNTIENITRGLTRQKNKCQGHRTSWRNPNQWVWHIHIDTDTLTHSHVCMCLYCVLEVCDDHILSCHLDIEVATASHCWQPASWSHVASHSVSNTTVNRPSIKLLRTPLKGAVWFLQET